MILSDYCKALGKRSERSQITIERVWSNLKTCHLKWEIWKPRIHDLNLEFSRSKKLNWVFNIHKYVCRTSPMFIQLLKFSNYSRISLPILLVLFICLSQNCPEKRFTKFPVISNSFCSSSLVNFFKLWFCVLTVPIFRPGSFHIL